MYTKKLVSKLVNIKNDKNDVEQVIRTIPVCVYIQILIQFQLTG